MAREVEAVGGFLCRAGSLAEARACIVRILAEKGARRVVRGSTPAVDGLELDATLEEAGLKVIRAEEDRPPSEIRAAELDADAGITSVDYAISETGTLALLARPGQGRAVSLLPPIHIAVLHAEDIVSDLSELFERVAVAETGVMPSAITFITGPSRTADIELVLTVGVHGPKELHLVLVG
jgi:L-lactate dehydrogenase complex protein LldG